jgi:hypothetical protein
VEPTLRPRPVDAQAATPAAVGLDRHAEIAQHDEVALDGAQAHPQVAGELRRRDEIARPERATEFFESRESRECLPRHA